ncbi:calcium/proton exchanger [Mycena belliarum]|uniref:Vacuolar calcium ion transporter n=1 Tax=Mycena belliarum TaxID=1033014 RepID=A0AAD6XY42_9AGAR|nr:calcium/proton exchanger [Mycena belliae]
MSDLLSSTSKSKDRPLSTSSTSSRSKLLLQPPTRSPTGNMEAGTPTGAAPDRTRSSSKLNFLSHLPKLPAPGSVGNFFRAFLKPAEEVGPIPSLKESLRAVVVSSYLNILLIFIPVSWALHFATPTQYAAIFSTGFMAIIPLAKLLAFATDDLSLRVGQALAGLINATLGNAVELIVAIIALSQCQLGLVQSSLAGSILSNLLLVLGMCFFTGGIRFSEQGFGMGAAQLNSSLLTLSAASLLLPTLYQVIERSDSRASFSTTQAQILKFSHGIAIIMLLMYISFIFFQLGSHTAMFKDDSADIAKSTTYMRHTPTPSSDARSDNLELRTRSIVAEPESTEPGVGQESQDSDIESPQMNGWICMGLLIVVCVFVALTAEFLVASIDGLTESGRISKEFVGIILLPIVGNAAEHASAVTVAIKDKLTLSIGVAVGSSIQIALFVIPLTVIVAWGMGKPMTLLFDPYEVACLFLAILTVNYVLQDGKSNWLEGTILMSLYAILATLFFFYPGMDVAEHFAVCK